MFVKVCEKFFVKICKKIRKTKLCQKSLWNRNRLQPTCYNLFTTLKPILTTNRNETRYKTKSIYRFHNISSSLNFD